MALTATFAADFSQFSKSIENATVQLGVFDRGAKSASRDLKREMESISGQKVAAEAARMAEAVKRLGGEGGAAAGLLKLTDSELQRLQSTMDAATAKAGKLGEALPDSLKQVQEQLAKLPKPMDEVSKGTGLLDASFAKLTTSFAAASIVDKVVGGIADMASQAIASAGTLVDLNASTGVSIETLQRWGQVAKLGGLQLEDMTTASFKLGAAIDGGGQSVREAVARLGLEFEKLRGLKPEEQMDVILRAAEKLGPTQERNAIFVDLFGERGAKSLSRIVDGYKETADAAKAATAEQIRAIDEAADAWDKFVDDTLTRVKAALGDLARESKSSLQNGAAVAGGLTEFTAEQQRAIALALGAADQFGNAKVDELMNRFRAENEKASGATKKQAAEEEAARQRQAASTRDYVAELVKLKSATDALEPAQRAQLDAALKIGASAQEIERRFGLSEQAQRLYEGATKDTTKALESADDFQARFNDTVSRNAEELKKATFEYQQFIATTNSKAVVAGDKWPDMTKLLEQNYTGPIAKALQNNVLMQARHADELDKLVTDRTETRLNADLAEVDRWVAAQKAQLDKHDASWQAAADAIDAFAAKKKEALNLDDEIDRWIEWNKQLGVTAEKMKSLEKAGRQQTVAGLREMSSAFADLAQSTGQTDGWMADMAEIVGLMAVSAEAGNQFAATLEKIRDEGKATVADILQLAASFATLIATMERATDVAGKANRAFRGAATGAQFGAQVGGAWGAIIGAVVGAVAGAARNPAWEDVMNRVGEQWGVQISKGLAKSIADQAKNIFGGNRQAAELFNLDAIIGEAGGLTSDNFKTMVARLHDVFSLLQEGFLTTGQALDILSRNWQAFVEAGTDAAGRLRPELVEIIRLTREMGLASKEVQAYVREQSNAAIAGANAIINASKQQFDSYQKIADSVKTAQEEIDKLNQVEARGRGIEWTKEMEKAQAKLTEALTAQHKAGEGAAGQLELMGRIAMGTYAAAIKGGMTHNEAMKAAAPGLSQLIKAYENLGITVEDAGLKAFLAQAKFVEANPEILAGIDGIAASMIGLSNMGLLDADMFSKLQQAGQGMYEQLRAKAEEFGLSGDEATRAALVPMQEYLHQAAEQAELLGVPLDENTQKLIDQSKAMGLWRDQAKDPMKEMTDAVREMRDAVKEMVNELKKIPANVTTTVKTRFVREDDGSTPQENTGPTAGPSGSSTVAAGDAGRGAMTITVPVSIDGRQVARATVPYIPAALRQGGV